MRKIPINKVLFTITVWIFLSQNAKMFNFSSYSILRWVLPVVLFLIAARSNRWNVPIPTSYIILFGIAVIPSFIQSVELSTSVSKAISFVLITYCFYVFFFNSNSQEELESNLRLAFGCILLFQVFNIVFCAIGLGDDGSGRYMGFTTNANTLGIYSNLAFWAAYYYYKHYKGIVKCFAIFMLVSSVILALLSGSRSGFVMIMLNVIIAALLNSYSVLARGLIIVTVGVTLYLMLSGHLDLNITALDRLLAEGGTGRGDIWDTGIRVWQDNPIFGCGYRASRFLNDSVGNEAMDFHNSYLSLLAEIGVWGVFWMILGVFPAVIRLIRQGINVFSRRHVSSFLIAGFMIASLLINAWSESFLFSVGSAEAFVFWMLFDWMIVCAIKMRKTLLDREN